MGAHDYKSALGLDSLPADADRVAVVDGLERGLRQLREALSPVTDEALDGTSPGIT